MSTALSSLLLLLLPILGLVSAQTPCCAPRQFEGLVSMRFSPNSTFHEAFSTMSYDFTNQAIASNETLLGPRETVHQRVLINGISKTMYIVDHHSRECRIFALTQSLDPPCVPSHFRAEGIFHFGAANDRLDFGSFRGRIGDVEAMIATSKSTCIPMSQMTFSERFHEVQSFVNITLGIRDRAVFNVPPECRRSGVRWLRPTAQQLRSGFPMLRSVFLGNF